MILNSNYNKNKDFNVASPSNINQNFDKTLTNYQEEDPNSEWYSAPRPRNYPTKLTYQDREEWPGIRRCVRKCSGNWECSSRTRSRISWGVCPWSNASLSCGTCSRGGAPRWTPLCKGGGSCLKTGQHFIFVIIYLLLPINCIILDSVSKILFNFFIANNNNYDSNNENIAP